MMDELTKREQAAEGLNEAGRRIILQILNEEDTKSLTEYLIEQRLRSRWLPRSRDWLIAQLREIEALGAVTVVDAGGELIARLTPAGQEHVEGVKRIPRIRWSPIGL